MPINVVVDLSHHNIITDFERIAGDGIVGIIHKATEGLKFEDKKYLLRKQRWLDMGYMWGSYHFASRGSGKDQADRFLNFVKPGDQDLLVLDYEKSLTGGLMPIAEAENFVEAIKDSTGRYPGLYSGNDIKEHLSDHDSILKNCWLWIAQYGSKPTHIPSAWSDWTMWQYTDGYAGNPPYSVNGIGQCDRNYFNGEIDDLKKLWNVKSE